MQLFLRIIRLLLKIVFFVLAFGLIGVALFYPSLLRNFIEWLHDVVRLLGWWNWPLAFGLGFIESVPLLGMAVPGQNALFVLGGFVAQKHWLPLVALVSCAIMAGDIVGYLLWRYQWERFIEKYGKYFGIGKTEIHYLSRALDKYGARAMVLSKRNGYARGIIPFIAGTGKMKWGTFILFNILWSVVYAALLLTLARIFVWYYQTIIPYIRWIMIGVLLMVWLYLWFFKRESLKRYLKAKEKELEETEAVLKEVEHKI